VATFNYKSLVSNVLFATVDADYCFLSGDTDCQGKIQILLLKHYLRKLQDKKFAFGTCCNLSCRPYLFITDNALPLYQHVIKPYWATKLDGISTGVI